MAARSSLSNPDEPGASDHPLPPAPLDRGWRRSRFSTGADTTCVEVALDRRPDGTGPDDTGPDGTGPDDTGPDDTAVLVRDSTDPAGPVLRFTAREWRVFLRGVRAGEFELP